MSIHSTCLRYTGDRHEVSVQPRLVGFMGFFLDHDIW